MKRVIPDFTPERARAALDEIHLMLDGSPFEPGREWTSSEIEYVACVITDLGYAIRPPNEEYDVDYEGLGQTPEEIVLLRKHDEGETLHPYDGPIAPDNDGTAPVCLECGDTAEGLMHNNTWRNVAPLLFEGDEREVVVAVTYTWVVSLPVGYESGDIGIAVQGYINSVGYAFDNPDSVEEQ